MKFDADKIIRFVSNENSMLTTVADKKDTSLALK
jgi:hypothetical protein